MTQYIKQPGAITIAPDFSGVAIDKVPAGYYRIACSQQLGFHLVPVDPLTVPSKVYGSLLKHAPRIKQVFAERVGLPTSVILEGLKGSGKSLLMKQLAKDFVEEEDGIVLLCNYSFTGDGFFEFLQQITQKKMVLMDEFDKTYKDPSDRNNILTLLDGTFSSHTLFVLTMNATAGSKGFEFFHNRPGRVFFNIAFTSVDLEAIQAYLEDCLDNKDRVAETMQYVKRFTAFNMDMLGTLVREMNAVPALELDEIGEYLNVKPDISMDDILLEPRVLRNGVDVTKIICRSMIESDRLKRFLIGMDKNQVNSLNFDSENNTEVRTDTMEVLKYGHKYEGDTRRTNLVLVGKEQQLIESFDEYISSDSATRTQDAKTGVLTITAKSLHDSSIEYVVELTPRIYKSYKYAF